MRSLKSRGAHHELQRLASVLMWLIATVVGTFASLVSSGSETDDKLIGELRAKAEKGDAYSQYCLGNRYHYGFDVVRDPAEAVKWYRKAAQQNYADAQLSLGACYDNGWGVKMDHGEAVKWDRKAAEGNHKDAQCKLGGRYARGDGVRKDYFEAYKWLLLAAGQGVWRAKPDIPELENKMSREEIAEGQQLARNFKPRELPSTRSDSSGTSIAQTRPESSGTGFFITEGLPQERVLLETGTTLVFFDAYPVTEGHALVIPKQHVASIFELPPDELAALWSQVVTVRHLLAKKYSPDGFSIGVNDGAAAGQTVPHAHIHVIPRRNGDAPDLRGGIRWIIPDKAKYW